MPDKILLRRGNKADLPTLMPGEPGFTTDTRELYVGSSSGNVLMWGAGNNTFNNNQKGYLKLANGLIIQWGLTFSVPGSSTAYNILFPLAFPNAVFLVVPSVYAAAVASCSAYLLVNAQFTVKHNASSAEAVAWIAIGS